MSSKIPKTPKIKTFIEVYKKVRKQQPKPSRTILTKKDKKINDNWRNLLGE